MATVIYLAIHTYASYNVIDTLPVKDWILYSIPLSQSWSLWLTQAAERGRILFDVED